MDETMKVKLTPAQMKAVNKMSHTEWRSAYTIGCTLNTLYALVRKDVVKEKRLRGAVFMPQNCITFKMIGLLKIPEN